MQMHRGGVTGGSFKLGAVEGRGPFPEGALSRDGALPVYICLYAYYVLLFVLRHDHVDDFV